MRDENFRAYEKRLEQRSEHKRRPGTVHREHGFARREIFIIFYYCILVICLVFCLPRSEPGQCSTLRVGAP